jgi:hypothetical protein
MTVIEQLKWIDGCLQVYLRCEVRLSSGWKGKRGAECTCHLGTGAEVQVHLDFTSTAEKWFASLYSTKHFATTAIGQYTFIMPADRLLGTLLRSLQIYTDQQDTPR